ncbi:MAG: hypothetical protein GXY88_06805 [Tissierellia bacterium]|nr:hypothetical protein [Tissierellia bacterium]
MGKLKGKAYNYILCLATGILIGILIGLIIMTTLVSYRMDQLYENIAYLENLVSSKDAKLEKLEESINTMQLVLKDIQIIISFQDKEMEDRIDKIEIEKAIKEKYNNLLGKEVKTIDPDLAVEVVDRRIFRLEGKEYRLRVNKLMLTEVLRIWIEVELIE